MSTGDTPTNLAATLGHNRTSGRISTEQPWIKSGMTVVWWRARELLIAQFGMAPGRRITDLNHVDQLFAAGCFDFDGLADAGL